jgi:hypothetical protein
MWVQKSLDRARRRLLGPAPEVAPAPPPPDPDRIEDLVVALGRVDLERFVAALAKSLDPHMPRPDSPARLGGALTTAIERAGGLGKPTVTRSPAGLYSPEYWHIRVEGADRITRATIDHLHSGRRLG